MHIKALYESVTQSIIKDLEAGIVPWVKPWKSGNSGGLMPFNAASKRQYNGINIPILWHAQQIRSFPTAGWLPIRQVDRPEARCGSQDLPDTRVAFRVALRPLPVPAPEWCQKHRLFDKRNSMSAFFSLNKRDLINGLVMTVGGAMLAAVAQQLNVLGFDYASFQWGEVLKVAVAALAVYLSKICSRRRTASSADCFKPPVRGVKSEKALGTRPRLFVVSRGS